MKKLTHLIFMSIIFMFILNSQTSFAVNCEEVGLYSQTSEGSIELTYTNYEGEVITLPDGLSKFEMDVEIDDEFSNEIKEVESLNGRYQFNYTGAGNSQRRPDYYRQALLSYLDGRTFYDGDERAYTEFKWLQRYIDYTNWESERWSSIYQTQGAALLEKLDDNDTKVYKAYLVISQVGPYLKDGNITLIGPDGKYIQEKMNEVYGIEYEDWYRHAGYLDITEFVKDQGYGWYFLRWNKSKAI